MLKTSKNNGFASFAEIIVASTIFLITAVGIYSTVAMVTPKAALSTRKLEAAYAGRSTIERLLSEVSAATWGGGGNLTVGVNYTINIGTMTIQYSLADVPGYTPADSAPRLLTMTVTY